MLRYKVRLNTELSTLDIPFDEDSLYISDGKDWISGVCDSHYELLDEERVHLTNGSQTLYGVAKCENMLRQGYVIVKENVALQSFETSLFDSTATTTVHYIYYNNRYFFEDISSYTNIEGVGNPTLLGTITMYENDSIRKPVQLKGNGGDYLQYVQVERVIYIDDAKFEYEGLIYQEGIDFELSCTQENGFEEGYTQEIIFDDFTSGTCYVYEIKDYRHITKFIITLSEFSDIVIDNIKQVERYNYVLIDGKSYEVFSELNGDRIIQYIEKEDENGNLVRINNTSSDPNFFSLQEDTDANLCCVEKNFINTSYRESEKGGFVYFTTSNISNILEINDILFETKNNFNGEIYVSEISGNTEAYSVTLNDVYYETVLDRSYFVKVDDEDYLLDIKDIVSNEDDIKGYTLAYAYINDAPSEFWLNENYEKAKRLEVKDSRNFEYKEYEIENRPTFIINGEDYPVYEKTIRYGTNDDGSQLNTNELTVNYINYNGVISGHLRVLEVIGNKTYICKPINENDILTSQYVVSSYENLIFTIANNLFLTPSLNDFLQSIDDTESYYSNEPYKLFKITKLNSYVTFPLLLSNSNGTNINQEDIVTNEFYETERRNAINPIVDMERDVYVPVIYKDNGDCGYPTDLKEVSEIVFNLHFRTRDMESWKINEESLNQITSGFTNWFITDYPYYYRWEANGVEFAQEEGGEEEEEDDKNIKYEYAHDELYDEEKFNYFESSDLLYFLKFTNDDVFYQKSKLSRSFLRLSFYDTPNPMTQQLLFYSTIFIDEGSLFKKYLSNTKVKNGNYFVDVSKFGSTTSGETIVQFDKKDTTGKTSNSISVTTELISGQCENNADEELNCQYIEDKDREDLRLSCRLTTTNRYATDTSSDGFYVYLFRDYSLQFVPRSIYMKAEFNHAGLGKTIQFMYPRKFSSEGLGDFESLSMTEATIGEEKYEVDLNNPYQVFSVVEGDNGEEINEPHTIQSKLCDDVNDFKDGYSLKDIFYQQYVEFKVIYDHENKRFCYYLPYEENKNSLNSAYRGNKMMINLWEIKVKNGNEQE